jgi:hypothetical protein
MIKTDRHLHGADPYGKTKFEGTGSILDEIFSKISKCISDLVKPIFDLLGNSNSEQIRNCDDPIKYNEIIKIKENVVNPVVNQQPSTNKQPTTSILLPVTEDRDEEIQFRRRFNIPSNGINTPSNRQPTSRVYGAGVLNDDDSDSESEIENSSIVENQASTTPHPVTVGTCKNSDAPQSTNDKTGVNPQSNSSDNPSTLLSKNNAAVDNKTITTAKDNKDDDGNDIPDDISVNFPYSHAEAAHKNTNQVSNATGSVENSDDDNLYIPTDDEADNDVYKSCEEEEKID